MDVKQKINLITINNYFGQSLPTHISLQTESLKGKLQAHGYLVDFVDIQEIQKSSIKEKEYYIIGSHQNPTIKKYIDDVLAVCFQGEHEKQLIPSRLNILAHENKGVQALISKRIDARYFPSQYYYYTLTPLEKKMVVKKPDGAGSSGVELASSTHELSKIIERFSILDYSIKDILFNIKNIAKKYIFTKKYSNE
ncbi:hypothetical protein R2312_001808, partial [Cronobacter turicensis]|nr:hypothetical protein [Cronobacter turicensis]